MKEMNETRSLGDKVSIPTNNHIIKVDNLSYALMVRNDPKMDKVLRS